MTVRPRKRSVQLSSSDHAIKGIRALIAGAAGLIVACLVAWASLPIPLSDSNPILAARVVPHSGTVLADKATIMLFMQRGDPEAVKEVNRDALLAEPMAFHAASGLALMQYLQGQKDQAKKLFELVGKANLRDKNSHAMLLQLALETNRPAMAVREAEVLMRQSRSLEPLASQVLIAMIDRGLSIPQLVDRLAEGPTWRSDFLAYLGANGKNPEQELKVFRGLVARGVPARGPELDAWLLRQAGTRRPAELAALWRALLPRELRADERMLRSGNLQPGTLARPFEWVFYVSDSGFAAREKAPGSQGQAMLVEFHGGEDVTLARQWTDLAPGRYRLQARALSGQVIDETATFVFISCLESGARLASVPISISQVDRWFPLSAPFTVGGDCPVQSLDVRGEGRLQGSYQQYYLDDFSIMPAAS